MLQFKSIFFLFFLLLGNIQIKASSPEGLAMKTNANIVGHVTADGKHLPFVNITVKGTTIGTVTDETGHFRLIHIPEGNHVLAASYLGYKSAELEVTTKAGITRELNISLEPDALGLNEVVVTGDRNERKRSESMVVVNTLSAALFNTTNSINFADALNFAPGLRVENNCQNCGFNQVRMNGMEGTYSQILINSRPIFSGLAGVYGLDLIPANMIERIEVVRGGGSALYGSNAIAGTVNVILKDPLVNSYEIGFNSSGTGVGTQNSGEITPDNSFNFNASMVTADHRTGLSAFGFHRVRDPFDANNDAFSEITQLNNTTLGTRFFHRFGTRNKLSVDLFNIKEKRRGGNDFHKLPHMADITESADHDIMTLALNFDQYFRDYDLLKIYASGQKINRDTYYGASQSLEDYGNTDNLTFNAGFQYRALFGESTLTSGFEFTGENLVDTKLGFQDFEAGMANGELIFTDNLIVADQQSFTAGLFSQYDFGWNDFRFSLGARLDNYRVVDKEKNFDPKTGLMLSPRVSSMYNFSPELQARLSYAQGYRAPQIFDEDLHIETSGARQVIHINSPDLTAETSHSYMASADFNHLIGNTFFSVLAEGFYTLLKNPFVLEFGEPDENGRVEYIRGNADENAVIQGVNTEINIVPGRNLNINLGITFQQSQYEEEQEFGEKRFFRSPNSYGFAAADWNVNNQWGLSLNGNYTGRMLVPYFGPELENPEEGILRQTNAFFDIGARLRYNISLQNSKIQVFAGVKNILNSYQNDFDTGIERDAGYLYGPSLPRTIYFGIRAGNLLK
jgi:outer membrane receptor for ferrienterochelin and colicins